MTSNASAWFVWLIARPNGQALWYGPRYLDAGGVVREEFAVEMGEPGARLYRLRWTGQGWQYDTRPRTVLLSEVSGYSSRPFEVGEVPELSPQAVLLARLSEMQRAISGYRVEDVKLVPLGYGMTRVEYTSIWPDGSRHVESVTFDALGLPVDTSVTDAPTAKPVLPWLTPTPVVPAPAPSGSTAPADAEPKTGNAESGFVLVSMGVGLAKLLGVW